MLEVIFSLIKHLLFNEIWSDNGGGLIPEVPLYQSFNRLKTYMFMQKYQYAYIVLFKSDL